MAGSEGHRAVLRALHALEIAVASEEGVALGEIADQLEAAKSSVHPLLKALVSRGYLTYEGMRYRAGPSVGALAGVDYPSVVPIAQPFMDNLLLQFDETVMLGRVVGETLIYLHSLESHQPVRYSPPRFRPPSDHPSSIEKLYLTQLDREQLDQYIAEHIKPDKREKLRAEIVEARRTGLAFNHGDTFPDLSAVAARIVVGHDVIACLAVGGPSRRIEGRSSEIAAATLEAATSIGQCAAARGDR
ncbi:MULTISPECIES: IclR family transcriptional regulator [Rhodococcus]|uniref:IclR family transcriptional regulator n=1 Tax=Rhodococcus opacus RKJ300 = JCM 13270 TaxID=1165867 RepID=I0WKV9_RHOOP|nr:MULTISPECIES: helix-turn-helix domain-containing protein [Rhodococcus]EID77025.1 IclR family transcriptional regulator [Rhodococcus opacus RKJ300 = JCM 13270]QQZ18812.1 helix-turn-helix domain-containing protein [Rhodococcus sp. 21391]